MSQPNSQSYFDALGLRPVRFRGRAASQELKAWQETVLKPAWRQRAKELHPDQGTNPDPAAFTLAYNAYNALMGMQIKSRRRARHATHSFNLDDIFDRAPRQPRQRRRASPPREEVPNLPAAPEGTTISVHIHLDGGGSAEDALGALVELLGGIVGGRGQGDLDEAVRRAFERVGKNEPSTPEAPPLEPRAEVAVAGSAPSRIRVGNVRKAHPGRLVLLRRDEME